MARNAAFNFERPGDLRRVGINDTASVVAGASTRTIDPFQGWANAGSSVTVSFTANSGGGFTVSSGSSSNVFSSLDFGYYLRTPAQGGSPRTFFSDTALNGDGLDHIFACVGAGQTFKASNGSDPMQALEFYLASEPNKPSKAVSRRLRPDQR